MNTYTPPYEITNTTLFFVSSISEKLGRITEHKGLDSKPHLRRNNKIKSIYSSLRIEANSLSLEEVSSVIDGHTVVGPAKEIQEVKNAYVAYEELASIDPFSISELKRIHGIMGKYVIDDAGLFRRGPEGVFQGDRCIFIAPPAELVPGQVEDLFAWMNREKGKVHPLIMAAVFHYEFVFIHPFSDRNGRMARLWHSAILARWKPIFEFIPIESQIEKFQDGYYDAISACHVDGKSNRFIEFMLEQIDLVLDEILRPVVTVSPDLSPYVKKLLSAMVKDVPYTMTDLLGLLNLKSRDTLRKNYLGPAIENGFVVMTLPDKPKSKNQRYKKN